MENLAINLKTNLNLVQNIAPRELHWWPHLFWRLKDEKKYWNLSTNFSDFFQWTLINEKTEILFDAISLLDHQMKSSNPSSFLDSKHLWQFLELSWFKIFPLISICNSSEFPHLDISLYHLIYKHLRNCEDTYVS